MIPYILHVTVIIVVCFIFYKLLLQKETFFRLNRWTLVICLLVAFGLPLVPVPGQWSWRSSWEQLATLTGNPSTGNGNPDVTGNQPVVSSGNSARNITTDTVFAENGNTPAGKSQSGKTPAAGGNITPAAASPNTANGTNAHTTPVVSGHTNPSVISNTAGSIRTALPLIARWAWYIYIFGVVVFAVNLVFQVIILLLQSRGRPVIQDGRFRIIEMTGDQAPCSFGNNIFINPARYDWETYEQIILHEKIHIRQGHTMDILLAETVLIFQWFNPCAWFYRREMEKNLEFLTDHSLLQHPEVEVTGYQLNLLKVAAPRFPLGITTNYNQSLLKRRILMMNSKRSSLHTVWKYFFLLPLLVCLVCGLNRPMAVGQSLTSRKDNIRLVAGTQRTGPDEGAWYLTTNKEKYCLELKQQEEGHSEQHSFCIPKTDFASQPTMGKCSFRLVREAGTLQLDGQFDGNSGFGHYTFQPDEGYFAEMEKQGIQDPGSSERFAFFSLNIKKSYVVMLKKNGFPDIGKNNLIAMAAMGIDLPYIRSWRDMGYTSMSENDIIAAKAMRIDSAWIADLHQAGYRRLEMRQLIAMKAQGIDGKYIRAVGRQYGTGTAGIASQTGDAVILDDAGSQASNAGVAVPVPDPVPSPSPVPGASPSPVITKDQANRPVVVVQDVQLSEDDGDKAGAASGRGRSGASGKNGNDSDLPDLDDLIAFKSLGIDSAYLESLRKEGYTHVRPGDLTAMKSVGVTGSYIRNLKAAGYPDIPAHLLITFKSLNVTPEYLRQIHSMGIDDLDLEQIPALKSLNITADYIRGFRDIGYKHISAGDLPALKSLGITPDYVLGFRKAGYKNIPLSQLPALKSMGITPAYIEQMRAKGFVSDDLNKYIQVKSAFN